MIPHEFVFAPIPCPGGATGGFALNVLRRGTIRKLRVVQLDGALEGFDYILYNTVAACQIDGSALAGIDERLYRITPTMTVASAKDSFASGEGFPEDGVSNLALGYACMDDHDHNPLAKSPTNEGNTIYLKIAAAGAGAKNFGVALLIEDPMIS